MSLSEIQEIAELISPKMTGKPFRDLEFFQSFKEAEKSLRFTVAAEAQAIRMEALKKAKENRRNYHDMKWPEFLQYCEAVMVEKGYLREPGCEP